MESNHPDPARNESEAGPSVAAKNSSPLVSVAIITYNQQQYLKECIDSVLAQDYPNVEIVVADDGSTDGTQQLLRDFDRRHPGRFRLVISELNRGVTQNSNAAHFACSGKYIAWMGGDDLMLQGKLRAQVVHMESNPACSLCYHNLDIFDSDSGLSLGRYNDTFRIVSGGIRDVIRYGTFNGACSTMVRSSQAPKTGFDVNIPVASDWLYWIESLAGGGTIDYIDQVLGRYRKHARNVTRGLTNRINQASLDHVSTCILLWHRYPMYRREIRQIYASHLWNNRWNLPGMGWGWASVAAHFRIGRMLKLATTDPLRRLLGLNLGSRKASIL